MGLNDVSDIIGCYRGKAVAIEMKVGRDTLPEAQARFLENWRRAGGIGLEARGIKAVAETLGIPMLL